MKPRLIVFTGAGISAESGLKTFRDSDGLWEQYHIEDVATPQAWARNPQLVQDFYNQRRKQVLESQPNTAHKALVLLEEQYDVQIITQNIDDLHERAGSSKVLHLHGEVRKVRSSADARLVYDLEDWELKMGDMCEKNSQLRPHIVWFGEPVPELTRAVLMASQADVFIVIGTSLNVYPAADLVNYVPPQSKKYLVDPNSALMQIPKFSILAEKASVGVPYLVKELLQN